MFGMEDPVACSEALTIVVVEHPSLAGVLKVAFDTIWERGLPFEQAFARSGQGLALTDGGPRAAPVGARRFLP